MTLEFPPLSQYRANGSTLQNQLPATGGTLEHWTQGLHHQGDTKSQLGGERGRLNDQETGDLPRHDRAAPRNLENTHP